MLLLVVYTGMSIERGCATASCVTEWNYAATLQNVLNHTNEKVTSLKMELQIVHDWLKKFYIY